MILYDILITKSIYNFENNIDCDQQLFPHGNMELTAINDDFHTEKMALIAFNDVFRTEKHL